MQKTFLSNQIPQINLVSVTSLFEQHDRQLPTNMGSCEQKNYSIKWKHII